MSLDINLGQIKTQLKAAGSSKSVNVVMFLYVATMLIFAIVRELSSTPIYKIYAYLIQ